MHKEVDILVEETLACYSRMTKLPVSRFTLSDLHFADKEMAVALQDKLIYLLQSSNAPEAMIKSVTEGSKYSKLLANFLTHVNKRGTPPPVKRIALPTAKQMSSEYGTLTPFMLTSMAKDSVELIGFTNGSEKSMWFSKLSETKEGFVCVDVSGKQVTILFAAVEEMGFSRIDKPQNELKAQCKKEAGRAFNAEDVKKVGFYLGKRTVAGLSHSVAMSRLNSILEVIPDDQAVKQKHPASVRKI